MRRATLIVVLALVSACGRPKPQTVQSQGLQLSYAISPDPAVSGPNQLMITVQDSAGRALDQAKVGFEYDMPAMGSMAEMRGKGEVAPRGGGQFQVRYRLPMGGEWTLIVDVEAAGTRTESRLRVATGQKGFSVEGAEPVSAAPLGAGADAGIGPLFDLSLEREQLIGVRFAPVEEKSLSLSIRAPGNVTVDERKLADVTLKYEAFIRKLNVAATGEAVRRGQPLLSLYSPDLLSAEQELLGALKAARGSKDLLIRAAEERLRLWDLSRAQIEALEKSGTADGIVVIASPVDGVVLEKNVVEGAHVMPGAVLYRIGNLGRIWVEADVYEPQAHYVRVGQPAVMTAPALPDETIQGVVSFVAPTLDERTRTLHARLEFANSALQLKPGMYADVTISVPLGVRRAIPANALLLSGEHEYVFVDRGPGRLQAEEVKVRWTGGDDVEVISGLQAGQRVVVGANFLVSSEAQLRQALPRWGGP